MHTRRLATLLLGIWICLSVSMSVVATQNFMGVDRMLSAPDPEAQKTISKLASGQARQLLRYQIGELNAYYFEVYGWAQMSIALLMGILLLFATNGHRLTTILSGVLVMLVVFQHFFLAREIIFLGQNLAYHTDGMQESRFHEFHSAFGTIEVVKGALLLLIGFKLLVKRERRRPMRSAILPDAETLETYR
jgi:hypothetical protein